MSGHLYWSRTHDLDVWLVTFVHMRKNVLISFIHGQANSTFTCTHIHANAHVIRSWLAIHRCKKHQSPSKRRWSASTQPRWCKRADRYLTDCFGYYTQAFNFSNTLVSEESTWSILGAFEWPLCWYSVERRATSMRHHADAIASKRSQPILMTCQLSRWNAKFLAVEIQFSGKKVFGISVARNRIIRWKVLGFWGDEAFDSLTQVVAAMPC
jgi:hypothetical protein